MVEGKRILLLLLVLCVALVSSSCASTSQNTHRKGSESAVLVVQCEVQDAEVWLNSRYYRTAGELSRGVRLRAGVYRIEVRHSDFHSMYYEVELAAKQRRTLVVALAQRFL